MPYFIARVQSPEDIDPHICIALKVRPHSRRFRTYAHDFIGKKRSYFVARVCLTDQHQPIILRSPWSKHTETRYHRRPSDHQGTRYSDHRCLSDRLGANILRLLRLYDQITGSKHAQSICLSDHLCSSSDQADIPRVPVSCQITSGKHYPITCVLQIASDKHTPINENAALQITSSKHRIMSGPITHTAQFTCDIQGTWK